MIVTALVHEVYKPVARLEQGLRGRVIDICHYLSRGKGSLRIERQINIPTTQNCPNGLTTVSLKRFDNSWEIDEVWGVGLDILEGGGGEGGGGVVFGVWGLGFA